MQGCWEDTSAIAFTFYAESEPISKQNYKLGLKIDSFLCQRRLSFLEACLNNLASPWKQLVK
jgi:hypothetical protein